MASTLHLDHNSRIFGGRNGPAPTAGQFKVRYLQSRHRHFIIIIIVIIIIIIIIIIKSHQHPLPQPHPHRAGTWPYFDQVDKGLAFEPTAVHRSPNEELLVAGDMNGAVKVFNYPCLTKDAVPTKHRGHIKEVSKVRFTCDGKHVISLGKHDRAAMVWNILPDEQQGRMAFS